METAGGLAFQDALPPRSTGRWGAPNRVNLFGRLGWLLAGVRRLGLPTAVVVSVVVFESYGLIVHGDGA
jgi:hypothetical protein